MYEEHRHKQCRSNSAKPIVKGWLIEKRCPHCTAEGEKRYLQIGTGQWCAANYATLFPLRRTAIIYATEFGYEIGQSATLVRHKSDPSCGGTASLP